jgi:deoxyribose-phosphate aldolase
MFSSLAFSERPFCDQTILLAGVAELSGIASKTSVGVGIMSGVASASTNFIQTSTGTYISSGANSNLSFNNTITSAAVFIKGSIIAEEAIDIESPFTQTANSIRIASAASSKDFNFIKTSIGEIKFVEVNASATPESYTEITPSGAESWTTITPSGTETWTEIQ